MGAQEVSAQITEQIYICLLSASLNLICELILLTEGPFWAPPFWDLLLSLSGPVDLWHVHHCLPWSHPGQVHLATQEGLTP